MNISMINETLFPVLLFALYFITLSNFVSKKPSEVSKVLEADDPMQPIWETFQEIEETCEDIKQMLDQDQVEFGNFSIRELRNHIQAHNLQAIVKEQLGKPYSRCSKAELVAVLA